MQFICGKLHNCSYNVWQIMKSYFLVILTVNYILPYYVITLFHEKHISHQINNVPITSRYAMVIGSLPWYGKKTLLFQYIT